MHLIMVIRSVTMPIAITVPICSSVPIVSIWKTVSIFITMSTAVTAPISVTTAPISVTIETISSIVAICSTVPMTMAIGTIRAMTIVDTGSDGVRTIVSMGYMMTVTVDILLRPVVVCMVNTMVVPAMVSIVVAMVVVNSLHSRARDAVYGSGTNASSMVESDLVDSMLPLSIDGINGRLVSTETTKAINHIMLIHCVITELPHPLENLKDLFALITYI